MAEMRKAGAYFLPGAVNGHIDPILAANPLSVSCNRQDWDRIRYFAQRVQPWDWRAETGTIIAYNGLVSWELWPELSRMVGLNDVDGAVDRVWAAMKKDADSFDQIRQWAWDEGHVLHCIAFGEIPSPIFTNQEELIKLALFMMAWAYRLNQHDIPGLAPMFKFSTGTTSQECIDWIDSVGALDLCRWHGNEPPIATFCVDEYAPIWLNSWRDGNQTEGLGPDATDRDRYDALFRVRLDRNMPQFGPAFLINRTVGDRGGRGIGNSVYGYEQMGDVVHELDEVGLDVVIHEDIPYRGNGEPFSGWATCINRLRQELGMPDDRTAFRLFVHEADAIYERFRIPVEVTPGQYELRRMYPARRRFGVGPGNADDWIDYDLCRYDWSADEFIAHLNDEDTIPGEFRVLVEPENGEEPPTEPPSGGGLVVSLQSHLLDLTERRDEAQALTDALAEDMLNVADIIQEAGGLRAEVEDVKREHDETGDEIDDLLEKT